jgi:hypothetical protein
VAAISTLRGLSNHTPGSVPRVRSAAMVVTSSVLPTPSRPPTRLSVPSDSRSCHSHRRRTDRDLADGSQPYQTRRRGWRRGRCRCAIRCLVTRGNAIAGGRQGVCRAGMVATMLQDGVRAELRIAGVRRELRRTREHVQSLTAGMIGRRGDATLFSRPAPVRGVAARIDVTPANEDFGPPCATVVVVARAIAGHAFPWSRIGTRHPIEAAGQLQQRRPFLTGVGGNRAEIPADAEVRLPRVVISRSPVQVGVAGSRFLRHFGDFDLSVVV